MLSIFHQRWPKEIGTATVVTWERRRPLKVFFFTNSAYKNKRSRCISKFRKENPLLSFTRSFLKLMCYTVGVTLSFFTLGFPSFYSDVNKHHQKEIERQINTHQEIDVSTSVSDSASETAPSPSPHSSLTHVHRCIGPRHATSPMTKPARLMSLSVFDNST